MKLIVLITGNKGKLAEVEEYMNDQVTLVSIALDLPEYQAASVEEVSKLKSIEAYNQVGKKLQSLTEEERNAPNYKTLLQYLETNSRYYVLVDDTSLEFSCLNSLPGPYIKWFLDSVGNDGLIKMTEGFRSTQDGPLLDHNDPQYAPPQHRLAKAVGVLSLCTRKNAQQTQSDIQDAVEGAVNSALCNDSEFTIYQFKGECEGVIVNAPHGAHGFGWDCIFASKAQPMEYPPYSKTYAELTLEEKRVISHRGYALKLLCESLPTIHFS